MRIVLPNPQHHGFTISGQCSKYKFEVSKKTIADPQKKWMRSHLKEYFFDSIDSIDFKNLDYFNHKIIKSEFTKFCKEENYPSTFAFFQILSFYKFNEVFFKKLDV